MDNKNPNKDEMAEERRRILKTLGVSATTGILGTASVAGVSSPVAASGGGRTSSDGPTVGTDQILPAPDGGGLTDAEWSETNTEQDYQSSVDLGSYINPGNVPIDFCADTPAGNEVCVRSADSLQHGTRDCSSGTTPTLYSMDVTIQEYESGYLSAEVSIWIGVDADTGCIWVGQEEVGACEKVFCDADDKKADILDVPAPWVDGLQDVKNWIDNNWEVLAVIGGGLTIGALAIIVLPLGTVVAAVLVGAGLSAGA